MNIERNPFFLFQKHVLATLKLFFFYRLGKQQSMTSQMNPAQVFMPGFIYDDRFSISISFYPGCSGAAKAWPKESLFLEYLIFSPNSTPFHFYFRNMFLIGGSLMIPGWENSSITRPLQGNCGFYNNTFCWHSRKHGKQGFYFPEHTRAIHLAVITWLTALVHMTTL